MGIDTALEDIDWNEPSTCPECGESVFRTVQVWHQPNENAQGKWKWLRGCNNCTYEVIIGNVK